jgi:hypothetical protein
VNAFPTPAHNLQNDGMTLRDYFAAQAMQVAWGMYEKLYDCPPEEVVSLVADYAYELADAMMEKRNAAQ